VDLFTIVRRLSVAELNMCIYVNIYKLMLLVIIIMTMLFEMV